MPPAMRVLVPKARVQDVARSVEFYKKLGFEVGNDFTPPGRSTPTWGARSSTRSLRRGEFRVEDADGYVLMITHT